MDDIDEIVAKVMKEMGCDPTKPPHWVQQLRNSAFGKVHDGYVCSYCGKHSWTKKEMCDGCNSVMN